MVKSFYTNNHMEMFIIFDKIVCLHTSFVLYIGR